MFVLLISVSQDAISQFGLRNKVAPARIFFFRDGVSEGEYDKVAATEVQAIRGMFQLSHLSVISSIFLPSSGGRRSLG
jgi:sulfur relay (sulfurtransferase) complex TusBCD TusD component (DsrE family)